MVLELLDANDVVPDDSDKMWSFKIENILIFKRGNLI
jgi:hypothetical protein